VEHAKIFVEAGQSVTFSTEKESATQLR
jgi:hypothetical protein